MKNLECDNETHKINNNEGLVETMQKQENNMDNRKSNVCDLCGKPTYGRICRSCWCSDKGYKKMKYKKRKVYIQ